MNDHSGPVEATEPLPATQGRPDPATAQQERRARWEKAIPDRVGVGEVIDAMMAVADAEKAGLKAEVERQDRRVRFLQSMVDSRDASIVVLDETCADWRQAWSQAAAEVERLKAEVTWDRLAAETGAERAQAEADRLTQVAARVMDVADLETARFGASPTSVTRPAPPSSESRRWPTSTRISWQYFVAVDLIRAGLDAPTEPAPEPPHSIGLDGRCHDCEEVRHSEAHPKVPEHDSGYGLWVGHPHLIAHDPPKREPEDPLAASKAAILKAMRGMEPTT